MSNTNIQDAYESVRKFNSIAGNLEGVTPTSVESQLYFIHEELNETWKATEDFEAIELLDGACDLFVTISGLMQKLEVAGFDVGEALKRVCENNLSKFPTVTACLEAPDGLLPKGTTCCPSAYSGYVVFKRNSDGKIMKPTNFVSVDLAGLAPEGFF
jgi:hypothetical protein